MPVYRGIYVIEEHTEFEVEAESKEEAIRLVEEQGKYTVIQEYYPEHGYVIEIEEEIV